MIGDALRTLLDAYSGSMRATNPLYLSAHEGRFTPVMLTYYLDNVRHLVEHTPIHLAQARDRAARTGHTDLQAHFSVKLHEEVGHDQWAVSDLEQARARFGATPAPARSTEMRSLIGFIEDTIDRDPHLYLAYILFVEYVVAAMGPEWIEVLHERCGISPDMMTVIGKHAELDAHHYEDGIEIIDELVTDPTMLPAMRRTLAETIRRFEAFGLEVTRYPGEAAAVA